MAKAMARIVVGPWLEQSEGEAPSRVPVQTPGRTEPVDRATANKVAVLGEKPMSVRDQLSKLRYLPVLPPTSLSPKSLV